MKRIYIQPQTKIEFAHADSMLAASQLDINLGDQSITTKDDDYNGEFAVQGYTFGDDFGE